MFDTIQISMATDMKSESKSRQCRLEIVAVVNEKRCIVDVVLFTKLTQKYMCKTRIRREKQAYMQEFVGFGIAGSVQAVALDPELNYSLVERNAIRGSGSGRP